MDCACMVCLELSFLNCGLLCVRLVSSRRHMLLLFTPNLLLSTFVLPSACARARACTQLLLGVRDPAAPRGAGLAHGRALGRVAARALLLAQRVSKQASSQAVVEIDWSLCCAV